FSRKLTAPNVSETMPLSVLVTTCLRMRAAEEAIESHCTDVCPDPTLQAKYHPFLQSSRRRGNKSLKMALTSRFMARGAGYVTLKTDRNLADMGIVSERSVFATKTGEEYAGRLLMKAESQVAACISKQKLQTINFCMDGASYAGEHVLSVVLRLGGYHFAGPTQMVNVSACGKTEAEQAVETLGQVLQGERPADATSSVGMPKDAFKFREYRTPTKNLLCALANSLQHVMPQGWTLLKCRPPNPLKPATAGCSRISYDQSEMDVMVPPPPAGSNLHLIWDSERLEARADHYEHEDFTRLVFAADEGTEAGRVGRFH
ncbi:unnamed protein product, partial [Symbiodinium necroappetens]